MQEVAPLIRQRWLDLCLKATTLPFKYRPLEILTHRLHGKGKYAVMCLRIAEHDALRNLADTPVGIVG